MTDEQLTDILARLEALEAWHRSCLEKPTKKQSFPKSPYFDIDAWCVELAKRYGWPREKAMFYHEQAVHYSANKSGKYMDWCLAVKVWDNKDPDAWRRTAKTTSWKDKV